MKLVRIFGSKIDLYQSIEDLPIYCWFKINETNNLEWLLKKKVKVTDYHKQVMVATWDKIIDEFVDTFGIPDKMKEILELKRDIFVLECEMFLSKDPLIKNFIKIKQFELRKLMETEKKKSTVSAKVYVEKFLGFRLNEKECTVKEFYEYIEAMKQQSKAKPNGR